MADMKPTPEELSAYFAKNKGFFNIPETRHLQLDRRRSSQSG